MVDARDRALSQLSALLPSPDEVVVVPAAGHPVEPAPRPAPAVAPPAPPPPIKKSPTPAKSSTESSPAADEWVPVAVASRKAAVDAATIRSWYRAGAIPTRRTRGERGAVLVPLSAVLARGGSNGSPADSHDEEPEPEVETPVELTAAVATLTGVEAPAEVELLRPQVDDLTAELDALRKQLDEERRLRHEAERERDEARTEVQNLTDQVKELEDHLTSPLTWSLDELASRPGYRGRWARGGVDDTEDDLVPASSD